MTYVREATNMQLLESLDPDAVLEIGRRLTQLDVIKITLPSDSARYSAEHMERYGHTDQAEQLRAYADITKPSSCS